MGSILGTLLEPSQDRAMNLPDRPCAQATITLVHPKDRRDSPLIEIYFEKRVQGRPGAAHAFFEA
jgi:hypothetical protein